MKKINKYELTIEKIEEINDELYDWNMKYFSKFGDEMIGSVNIDELMVDIDGNIFAPTNYSVSGDVYQDNDIHTVMDERTVNFTDYEKMSVSL